MWKQGGDRVDLIEQTFGIVAIAAVIILLPVFSAYTECVDFESLALGTQYGDPVGHVDGDLIFTENGIPVTVHNFEWSGGA